MPSVFERVDREVWIVTARDTNRRGGLTATWVSQASLDPERPTVMIGIAPSHFTSELIDASRRFGLHLLHSGQVERALHFALRSGREMDKLEGASLVDADGDPPLLADCLAWLDCAVYARLSSGDRIYYWADVLRQRVVAEREPLREQALIAAASENQRGQLRVQREADVALQREQHAQWRAQLPRELQ